MYRISRLTSPTAGREGGGGKSYGSLYEYLKGGGGRGCVWSRKSGQKSSMAGRKEDRKAVRAMIEVGHVLAELRPIYGAPTLTVRVRR